jgi:hypothetical protein
MKSVFAAVCMLLGACAWIPKDRDPFVGTWVNVSHGYYLRVYPDGQVAQWPSPPDGEVSWSRHKDGELQWNYLPQLRNPVLHRSGRGLTIDMNSHDMTMVRVESELEPGNLLPR